MTTSARSCLYWFAWGLAGVHVVLFCKFFVDLAVDVPVIDQWWFAGLLHDLDSGTKTLAAVWEPHNEHRMPATKLLMLALSRVSHWDTRLEIYCNLGFAVATLVVLLAHLLTVGEIGMRGPAPEPRSTVTVCRFFQAQEPTHDDSCYRRVRSRVHDWSRRQ